MGNDHKCCLQQGSQAEKQLIESEDARQVLEALRTLRIAEMIIRLTMETSGAILPSGEEKQAILSVAFAGQGVELGQIDEQMMQTRAIFEKYLS